MNKKHRYAVHKLVRDKTGARLESGGCSMKYHVMDNAEYKRELHKKLLEEANEVIEAQDTTELISELADVLELLHAIAKASSTTFEEIEQKRQSAREARGGFDNKIYSEHVDVYESSPQWLHYKDKPEKYPELPLEDYASSPASDRKKR